MSAADVEAFLRESKTVPDAGRLTWRQRSEHVQVARLAVEAHAIELGELVLIVNVAHSRWWIFKLLLHSTEVSRWDFLPNRPRRHRNPPDCPAGDPPIDRSLEHEHVWHEGLSIECSRPLQGAAPTDHSGAYARFCDASNIDPKASYVAPPQPGQQLQLP